MSSVSSVVSDFESDYEYSEEIVDDPPSYFSLSLVNTYGLYDTDHGVASIGFNRNRVLLSAQLTTENMELIKKSFPMYSFDFCLPISGDMVLAMQHIALHIILCFSDYEHYTKQRATHYHARVINIDPMYFVLAGYNQLSTYSSSIDVAYRESSMFIGDAEVVTPLQRSIGAELDRSISAGHSIYCSHSICDHDVDYLVLLPFQFDFSPNKLADMLVASTTDNAYFALIYDESIFFDQNPSIPSLNCKISFTYKKLSRKQRKVLSLPKLLDKKFADLEAHHGGDLHICFEIDNVKYTIDFATYLRLMNYDTIYNTAGDVCFCITPYSACNGINIYSITRNYDDCPVFVSREMMFENLFSNTYKHFSVKLYDRNRIVNEFFSLKKNVWDQLWNIFSDHPYQLYELDKLIRLVEERTTLRGRKFQALIVTLVLNSWTNIEKDYSLQCDLSLINTIPADVHELFYVARQLIAVNTSLYNLPVYLKETLFAIALSERMTAIKPDLHPYSLSLECYLRDHYTALLSEQSGGRTRQAAAVANYFFSLINQHEIVTSDPISKCLNLGSVNRQKDDRRGIDITEYAEITANTSDLIEQFAKLPNKKQLDVMRRANPMNKFEKVHSPLTTFYKLAEFSRFFCLDYNSSSILIIGSCPGGFAQYILSTTEPEYMLSVSKSEHVFEVPLPDKNGIHEAFVDPLLDFGNLETTKNLQNYLQDYVFDYVLIDLYSHTMTTELYVKILCNVFTMFNDSVIHTDASFVLVINTVDNLIVLNLLSQLSCIFETMNFVIPSFSEPGSQETYILLTKARQQFDPDTSEYGNIPIMDMLVVRMSASHLGYCRMMQIATNTTNLSYNDSQNAAYHKWLSHCVKTEVPHKLPTIVVPPIV